MTISNSTKESCKLFSLHYNQCDPKKCTSLKLNKLNLLKIIKSIRGNLKESIILTPFALQEIKLDDREKLSKNGLIVIDCSWKKILSLPMDDFKYARKLPPLIATNPTNYGKWEKLTSVEALAAALYITDYTYQADMILSKFSWGIQFKTLNKFEKKSKNKKIE